MIVCGIRSSMHVPKFNISFVAFETALSKQWFFLWKIRHFQHSPVCIAVSGRQCRNASDALYNIIYGASRDRSNRTGRWFRILSIRIIHNDIRHSYQTCKTASNPQKRAKFTCSKTRCWIKPDSFLMFSKCTTFTCLPFFDFRSST